ncbi:MAG: hypothetical protein JSR17_04990 [Proteobacteria bacterium]|nr:hypothetical protein [Pseudomonadota bacterium]
MSTGASNPTSIEQINKAIYTFVTETASNLYYPEFWDNFTLDDKNNEAFKNHLAAIASNKPIQFNEAFLNTLIKLLNSVPDDEPKKKQLYDLVVKYNECSPKPEKHNNEVIQAGKNIVQVAPQEKVTEIKQEKQKPKKLSKKEHKKAVMAHYETDEPEKKQSRFNIKRKLSSAKNRLTSTGGTIVSHAGDALAFTGRTIEGGAKGIKNKAEGGLRSLAEKTGISDKRQSVTFSDASHPVHTAQPATPFAPPPRSSDAQYTTDQQKRAKQQILAAKEIVHSSDLPKDQKERLINLLDIGKYTNLSKAEQQDDNKTINQVIRNLESFKSEVQSKRGGKKCAELIEDSLKNIQGALNPVSRERPH